MNIRRVVLVAALALAAGLGGCTDRGVTQFENSLWQMFAGHDKPVILKKAAPPVYCYQTIGTPVCYDKPRDPVRGRPDAAPVALAPQWMGRAMAQGVGRYQNSLSLQPQPFGEPTARP